ncbi:hypothetical protein P872_06460 [Rhodonellum psychrophilum GCM71 = DSM 17998]|uniref:Transcriptional regulator MraZ n=2 Tax=Rhodonellum TaxID=336827 RepID=U5BYJ7_9BACT|nr:MULTISPECIES: division/cell wall cluster transcriptional repressor MraZ [Rhodonellum]ERM82649.1 hypothetical protein P872_06460 [Rhodonellum psychrophilum GCM71 = DSM 17998]MDO9553569.1 division/cell wall cluster transcriptional repressor MraZ [Rhodonellum sp.]
MGMFNNQFDCKLDAKGRLTLPAKIKAAIPESNGNELMLRLGNDGCLELYTMIEFKKLYNQVNALNSQNEEQRLVKRNFFRGNNDVELDGAGRLLIPKTFMLYADIEKDAVVVGMGSYVEIWNPEKYLKYVINDPSDLSRLMEKYLS